jgi:serine/threonine protein kinase
VSDPFGLSEPLPQKIGRYEVFERLGSGAVGIVLRAYDPIFQRQCALKVPHVYVLADHKKQERFLAGARALASLNHDNVVRVFDTDQCGLVCYIAMEFCQLGSLADWLSELPADVVIAADWAARLAKQIADGVQHVHERRIYHRDLKPANILLTSAEATPTTERPGDGDSRDLPRFCPKVSDFDLAKILDDDQATLPGALIGTRPYMAPEQVRGNSAAIGPATDVWALGVILYELLTRQLPFGSAEDPLLDQKICNQDPVPPRTFRKDVSRGLQRVCLRCLEKSPSDRYQSSRELAYELARVLDGRPPSEPHWKWIVRWSVKRVKRHPFRTALLGLALVTVLATAWLISFRQQSNAAVQRAKNDALVQRIGAAPASDLADLLPQVDPRDRTVADQFVRLFETGTSDQKLNSAIVLAKLRPESQYAGFCYEWLLDADPQQLSKLQPVAELLKAHMAGLVARLEDAVSGVPPPSEADRERHDHRRANAACVLILLGSSKRGWLLLRSCPDPQIRTFLIHQLGPAGVEPRRILKRLNDPAEEPTIRMALIQSLSWVPDVAREDVKAQATQCLLDIYRDDPNAGVHGSAKWLLREWGKSAEIERIDGDLAKRPPERHFEWRISRQGLTLITVKIPTLHRIIEVSDTETTVALYRKFKRDAQFSRDLSPDDSCPIHYVSYYNAVAFCNWLTIHGEEEIGHKKEPCYRATGVDQTPYEPVPGHRELGGFRLPTNEEFTVYCAAGTNTRRYFGNSDLFFDRYAWIMTNSRGRTHPVATRIPNDFGLFDTLGNILEWCESSRSSARRVPFQVDLRGGWFNWNPPHELELSSVIEGQPLGEKADVEGEFPLYLYGFRVVRTKKDHQGLDASVSHDVHK